MVKLKDFLYLRFIAVKIKEFPEDFIVEEVINLKKLNKGDYSYFKLIKKNWNTIDVIEKISSILRIKLSSIGFAGNKDKMAITTQYISIYKLNPEAVKNIKIKDVKIEFFGYGNRPVYLGMLEGNKFKIKFKTNKKIDFVVNYFGPQRFSKNNHKIGKLIILGKFKNACEFINNKKINTHLEKNPKDFVGALNKLRKKLPGFYVHSYQSYLWNKAVQKHLGCRFLEKKVTNYNVPLVSFDMNISKKFKDVYDQILKEEKVELKDFLIRSIPEITPTRTERDMIIDVKDFKSGKGYIEFFLQKGSYATVVLEKLLKTQ